MPISSFYGMQTSLRGLIAQQRMLDTTGHNIANASTAGYSRQEALLSASLAQQIQVSGAGNMTGAHLGSGVDVQGFRRVRDNFLDAQYRAQNTNLNDWKARAEGLDSAELSLNEPSDTGINAQLSKFWQAWSDLAKAPDDQAAKQALVQQAGALTDSIHSVRSQMVAAKDAAMGQYNEALVKAGILLSGEGLQPSSKGARVRFSGDRRTVIDGPFAETKELVAGFWIWQVQSMDEAVEWAKRCPNPMPGPSDLEIRPLWESVDFGPEIAAQENALRARIATGAK